MFANISIKQALNHGRSLLDKTSPSSIIDCEILLCAVLGVNKSYLYTYPERVLTQSQQNRYQELLSLRATGMPIAYIIGHKEFWSLPFKVSPATLIPRTDTEILVEKSLEKLKTKNQAKILELGTGSGIISITIAKMRPDVSILACDICEDALAIARNNAKLLAVDNVKFILSNWFKNINSRDFDAIIANPPYIAENDPHLYQGDVKFEPPAALTSGADGLDAIRHIIANSHNFLAKHGFLMLEHGYNQRDAIAQLLKLHGYKNLNCWQDLGMNDRVSYGEFD